MNWVAWGYEEISTLEFHDMYRNGNPEVIVVTHSPCVRILVELYVELMAG